MCGIAGFSRPLDHSSIPDGRHFARALALAIESRGKHATGFGWDQDGWPWAWKQEGSATRVAHLAPLPVGMNNAIVHTRYATKGRVSNNDNNHPLFAPGIVLVHNGRVSNDDELIAAVGHARVGQVDSEALAALVSLGPEALGANHITDVLSLVDGPTATMWLDVQTPGTLHLARLRQRPLAYGFTRKGDFVAASTPAALNLAAEFGRVRITGVTEMDEGTYLRVVNGVPVEQVSFDPLPCSVVAPADVPQAHRHGTWETSTTSRVSVLPVARVDEAWQRQAERIMSWTDVPMADRERLVARLVKPSQLSSAPKAKEGRLINGIDWNRLAPRRGWR